MGLGQSDLTLTLLILGRWTLMPELLDFFGGDSKTFLRFIDLFGGTTIEVPQRAEIARMARNTHIWTTMRKDPTADKRLAAFYDITPEYVRQVVTETEAEINGLDQRTGTRGADIADAAEAEE